MSIDFQIGCQIQSINKTLQANKFLIYYDTNEIVIRGGKNK